MQIIGNRTAASYYGLNVATSPWLPKLHDLGALELYNAIMPLLRRGGILFFSIEHSFSIYHILDHHISF